MARTFPRRIVAFLPVPCFLLTLTVPAPAQGPSAPAHPEEIAINDNRHAAGVLRDGVLTVRLEARHGTWRPEGAAGPALAVAAFAEEGRPAENPGPLIRVPAGTEVRATIRNSLGKPLTIFGMGAERGLQADSFVVEPGTARELRFRASAPGTYYYAGKTTPVPVLLRSDEDSQLNGAIVVDPPGSPAQPRDRVFLISWWFRPDSTALSGLAPGATLAINGLSWPHTERFDVAQGDSLHWRWINMIILEHPLHLHGFYYRLDGKGDGRSFTGYAPDQRRLAVTETLHGGETLALAWSPTRPGNWIFHCHFASHMTSLAALNSPRRIPAADVRQAAHAHGAHGVSGGHQMAGLVLGITVRPGGQAAAPASHARHLRLLIRSKAAVYGEHTGYGFVLGGSPEEARPGAWTVPGPALELEQDQPVAITLVNQSHEPAAVHWHGIELESFPDGVPGWSGEGTNVLPAVPPGDSLTVRFTPPRAGTFMYHSHFNEFQQIAAGLFGPIIVTRPGERRDPETDRVLLFSDAAPTLNLLQGPFPPPVLNGRAEPEPLELRAGTRYRFRLINIRTDYIVKVALLEGDQPAQWRPVAKDGADLPPSQATPRPAELSFGAGEIWDFEFTPARPGELVLTYVTPDPEGKAQPTRVPVRVR